MLADAVWVSQGAVYRRLDFVFVSHSLESQSAPLTMAFAVGEALVSVTPPFALNIASVAASNDLPTNHDVMVSTTNFQLACV